MVPIIPAYPESLFWKYLYRFRSCFGKSHFWNTLIESHFDQSRQKHCRIGHYSNISGWINWFWLVKSFDSQKFRFSVTFYSLYSISLSSDSLSDSPFVSSIVDIYFSISSFVILLREKLLRKLRVRIVEIHISLDTFKSTLTSH